MIGEGAHRRRLALAREDRQRNVVEHGHAIEQIDDLKAARNAGLDALGHCRKRDVVAFEQNLAGIGLQMRADQIDERGLAGAVRPDEGELALLHDEIHAVAGAGFAELFAQIDSLKQDRHGFTFMPSLLARNDSAPTMPVGNTIPAAPGRCRAKLPILGRGDRVGLEIGEHDAADDGAGEIAEAAEECGEHDLA